MTNSGVTVPEDDVGTAGSVPYIQAADLNDGDILNQTKKFQGPGTTIILRYYGDNGELMAESPPIQQELVGKAMLGWVDQVKSLLVQKAAEASEEALRKARAQQLSGPGLEGSMPHTPVTDAQLRQTVGTALDAGKPPPDPEIARKALLRSEGPPNADGKTPLEQAKANIKWCKRVCSLLTSEIAERQVELTSAQRRQAEWQIVVDALTKGVKTPTKRRRRRQRQEMQ